MLFTGSANEHLETSEYNLKAASEADRSLKCISAELPCVLCAAARDAGEKRFGLSVIYMEYTVILLSRIRQN